MPQFEVLAAAPVCSDAAAVVRVENILPDGREIYPGQAAFFEEKNGSQPYSIYTAMPKWRGGAENEAAALASCCRSCLRLAVKHRLLTVDFPSAATEAGYSVSQIATVAERAIMDFLREHTEILRVRIICDSEQEAEIYRRTYNLWYAETKSERL